MGFFDAFREEGYPTRYGDNRTVANLDISEALVIAIFGLFVLSFFVILPGIRGVERLTIFVRVMFSILVTTVIIISNFGMGWESSEISTKLQYKAGMNTHINASVGIWFGLRGVNVTLKGRPVNQMGEQIDYNEQFTWAWRQGKPGFGPDAGVLQKQFREAQRRGAPYPITWIVEYLTYDGDGMRFGRSYRIAGWYTHILLWLSLPLWILSNILMSMVIRYGALFMGFTGTSMVLACIVYSCVRNPGDAFFIKFEDGMLEPTLGWCFYVTLLTGASCIVVALFTLFMDLRFPDHIATFFGVDALQDYEEFYVESTEELPTKPTDPGEGASEPNNGVQRKSEHKLQAMPALRKRTASVRFQKSHRRVTLLDPHSVIIDKPKSGVPTYENVGLKRIDTEPDEASKNGSKEQFV